MWKGKKVLKEITLELAEAFGVEVDPNKCVEKKNTFVKQKKYPTALDLKKMQKMCFDKNGYYSEARAREVAKEALELRQVVLHGYICDICHKIHLTKEDYEGTNRIF